MAAEVFSAVADLVSAIAIVASLVYLAIQVRKAQVTAESQSLQAAEALASNWRTSLSRDPQVAGLWLRATKSFASLSPEEKEQARWLFSDLFWIFQGMSQRIGQGAMDSESQVLLDQNIAEFVKFPGIREWWGEHRNHYSKGLADVVEKHIAKETKAL